MCEILDFLRIYLKSAKLNSSENFLRYALISSNIFISISILISLVGVLNFIFNV